MVRELPPPAVAAAAMLAAEPDKARWKEYFIYSADFVAAAALPAGTLNGDPTVQAFSDFPIRIHSDADFEWIKTIYTATDPRVYARLRDDTSGRQLHRSTLDLRAAAGAGIDVSTFFPAGSAESTAFLPFIEPDPYVIAAASSFIVSAADFSGALNAVRISFHGNKIRPGYAPYEYDEAGRPRRFRTRLPYKVVLPPDGTTMTIGANASIVLAAPIDIEADFIIKRVTAIHTASALVTIQDGAGRERLWMDRAVDIRLLVGNGLFPNILPSPRFVYRGSTIQATIQDTSGAANRIKLIFSGDKLYEA